VRGNLGPRARAGQVQAATRGVMDMRVQMDQWGDLELARQVIGLRLQIQGMLWMIAREIISMGKGADRFAEDNTVMPC
jgi:hypothetical protein